ncbi:MAG: dephospho-CoA kinase [Steroidobacterales bacterium]
MSPTQAFAASGARPLRIGLTGGIASGKSTVAELFKALGIAVIDADQIAREVVAPGTPLLHALIERFGRALLLPDGSLDRRALRALVFADPAARRELEALLHPAIRARTEALSARAPGPYQIHVVPLLIETHAAERYDRILVVDCDESLQLARLMQRDGMTADQAGAMLAAQGSRAARLAAADDVIVNTGAADLLPPAVAALHKKYLALPTA